MKLVAIENRHVFHAAPACAGAVAIGFGRFSVCQPLNSLGGFSRQRFAMRTSVGVTYLHSDHLGITNAMSGAIQTTGSVYFSFGSPRAGNPPTDYTFTGQKFDSYMKLLQMVAKGHA